MNILIIGNGFDLAHGLPTKYEHFLKYVDAFKRFEDSCRKKSIKDIWQTATEEDQSFLIEFSNLYETKRKLYEEIDTLVTANIWIDHFWEIYKNRSVAGNDGWIDFESEISKIIQTLDAARSTILNQIKQGHELGVMAPQQSNILSPILKKLKKSSDCITFDDIEVIKTALLTDLNKLTRCLEIYLINYVEKKDLDFRLPDVEKLDVQYVLSFNYTHTYQEFYHKDKNEEIHYDYIHGETRCESNIDNCNLILGIDEYLVGDAKDKENEFIQFKKFYQRIYKMTGCKYVDWINSLEQLWLRYGSRDATHNIYIIGHSLDITDKDILSSLINLENVKTTIFYHSQAALGSQINNLVKVLGEDNLIAKVHGKNARIVFQKQQEPIKIR